MPDTDDPSLAYVGDLKRAAATSDKPATPPPARPEEPGRPAEKASAGAETPADVKSDDESDRKPPSEERRPPRKSGGDAKRRVPLLD
jgi:hypothetical protein